MCKDGVRFGASYPTCRRSRAKPCRTALRIDRQETVRGFDGRQPHRRGAREHVETRRAFPAQGVRPGAGAFAIFPDTQIAAGIDPA